MTREHPPGGLVWVFGLRGRIGEGGWQKFRADPPLNLFRRGPWD